MIKNNLIESWHLLKGSKGPMWAPLLVWILITIVILSLGWLTGLLSPATSTNLSIPIERIILTCLIVFLTASLFAGVNMIAIKRARGETVNLKTGFQYFKQWLSLGIAFIIIFIISVAFTTLINLVRDFLILPLFPEKTFYSLVPLLFLMVVSSLCFTLAYTFFIFTIPFIADRQLSVLNALKQSILMVKAHWLALFGLMAIFYILSLANMLLAQIPYAGTFCYIIISIWLIPFIFLNIGVAYHHLVDYA